MTIEWQVVAAVAALYLYDAAVALQPHEGVLWRSPSGWHLRWADQGQYFARRMLLWPPLFALHVPVFRLGWNPWALDLATRWNEAEWSHRADALRGLAVWCYAQGALMALALPWALLVGRSEALTLGVLGAIYLVALTQAWYIRRHGSVWGLDGKARRSICLDCLLCPPMGVNAVRKVSLQQRSADNLLAAAATVLSPEGFAQAKGHAMDVLSEAMEDCPPGSPEAGQLQQAMQRLQDAPGRS